MYCFFKNTIKLIDTIYLQNGKNKSNLKLHGMLQKNTMTTVKPSMAKRAMLDKERERIVNLYRQQKKDSQINFKEF